MNEQPRGTVLDPRTLEGLFLNMTEGCALMEIVADEQGRPVDYLCLDVNPAFERLTGLPRGLVVGKPVTDVLPGFDLSWAEPLLREVMSKESVRFEKHIPPPLDRTYEANAYRISPARFALIFTDVTERRATEAALRVSEERFRIIASSTPDHLLVQDRDLRYTMVVNPQLGLTEKDMLGQRDQDFLSRKDADRLTAIKRRVLETGKPVQVEVPLTSREGRPGIFEGTYVPKFDPQGQIDGLIGYFKNVTERRKAEDLVREQDRQLQANDLRLREARDLLEAVTSGTEVIIATVDRDLRYTFFNQKHHQEIKRLTGKDTVLGMSLPEVLAEMPEERDKAVAVWRRALEGETIVQTLEFGDPNGYRRWYSTRHTPIRDAQGTVVGAGEVTSDITEFMRTQQALRESEKRTAADLEAMTRLNALGMLSATSEDLGPVLGEIVEAAMAISGSDFGNIQLLDPRTSRLQIVAQRNFPQWWVDYWNAAPPGNGASGWALIAQERIVVEDIETSPIFLGRPTLEVQRQVGVRAVQSTPLVTRAGKPIGMFSTHWKTPGRPDDRILRLLDLLARQAADIIERAQVEEELTKKTIELESLFNHSSAGLVLFDAEPPYRVLAHNRYYQELFDEPFRTKGMAGLSVYEYAPEPEAKGIIAAFEDVIRTGETRDYVDFPYDSNPAHQTWFNWHLSPVIKDGKVIALASLSINVTDRHRAEAQLSESRKRYQDLIETTSDFIWEMDAQGRYTYCSPQMERMWGLKPEQMMGRTPFDLMPDKEKAEAIRFFSDLVRSPRPFSGQESASLLADGRMVRVETSGIPFFDRDGRLLGWRGITRDISERKQAEARREADLAALTRMHDLSSKLLDSEGLAPLLQEVMNAAVAVVGADKGTLQLLESGSLRIVSHCGHAQPFLDFFSEAEKQTSVCGAAMRQSERVIVPDIETSPLFAGSESLAVLREAGVRAVQSTPLFSRNNTLLGVLTTHWSAPYVPDEHDLWRLDLLGRQAADLIEVARTKEELSRTNQRLAEVLESIQDDFYVLDRNWVFVYANKQFTSKIGKEPEDFIGRNIWEMFPKHVGSEIEENFRASMERGEVRRFELGGRYTPAWYSLTSFPSPEGITVLGTDITRRRRAEEQLRQSEERLRAVLDNSRDVIVQMNLRTGQYEYISASAKDLVGYSPEDLLGMTREEALTMVHPDDIPVLREAQVRSRESGDAEAEYRQRTKDGRYVWVSNRMSVVRDEAGRPSYRINSIRDITLRKRDEEALRESARRLAGAEEMAHLGSWELNVAADRIDWSDEVYRIFGLQPQEFRATYRDFLEAVHPDDRERVDASYAGSLREGRDCPGIEYRIIRRDTGETRVVQARYEHRRDASGRVIRTMGTVLDITEPKRAEALRHALAEQERLRLGAAVEQASDAVIMIDLDGTIRYVNVAFETINSTPRDQVVGRSYFDLLGGDEAAKPIGQAVTLGRTWRGQLTRSVGGGRQVDLDVTISPALDPANKVIGGLVTEKDVTQENALQRQVRQSQKMEALGTLAGGITHDFNNILGAIIINSELALLDLESQSPLRRPLSLVLQAANRGKELVKQIITFSRQREWERKPIDMGAVVREALKFMSATLPRNILVQESIAPDSGTILGDPSQVHQIIVNLCSNAALAMQERGGTLTIRVEPMTIDTNMVVRHPELTLGRYVLLTVADTGCGMTREVMERIFEPFFTTRPHGQGSGLGLPVVHGITRAYNGLITVTSEVGRGSIFRVYIPVVEGKVEPEPVEPGIESARGERILLVEDETAQRASLARSLKKLGYGVMARASGRAALAAFRRDPRAVDLVVTDQRMSGMTGLELAAALVKLRPDIPIILCTGFSEQVDASTVGQNGVRELIMKPFTLQDITQTIAKVLKNENGKD